MFRVFLLVVGFQVVVGEIEFRDSSGLFNLKEFSGLINSLCDKVNTVSSLLKSPLSFGVGKKLLSKGLPLPGPGILDPLHLIRFLVDKIGELEDKLSTLIEKRLEKLQRGEKDDSKSEERSHEKKKDHSDEDSDEDGKKKPHYFLEIGDLLGFAEFICKTVRLWNDLINTPLADISGLAHIRLPIPDFKHKFNFLKAIDFLDIEGIPHRIERIIDGEIVTTTTEKPGFFENLFHKDKPTTPSTKKPSIFQRILNKFHSDDPTTKPPKRNHKSSEETIEKPTTKTPPNKTVPTTEKPKEGFHLFGK